MIKPQFLAKKLIFINPLAVITVLTFLHQVSNCSNIEEILYLEKGLSNEQRKAQVAKIQKKFGPASILKKKKMLDYLPLKLVKLLLMLFRDVKIVNDLKNLLPELLQVFPKPHNLIKRYLCLWDV